MDYFFQFGPVLKNISVLLKGLQLTIILGVGTGLLGVLTGWILVFLRSSKNRTMRFISVSYIEFWRNTPLIIQLFFVYFGITALVGFSFSAIMAGFIAIMLNTTAYYAEILRGGVQVIPKIQLEAAESIGLTRLQIIFSIIVPLTMKTVFASLVNQFILTVLGTSVFSIISVPDLLNEAKHLQAITGRTIEIYFVVAIIYISLILVLSLILKFVEKRYFTLPELMATNKQLKAFKAP